MKTTQEIIEQLEQIENTDWSHYSATRLCTKDARDRLEELQIEWTETREELDWAQAEIKRAHAKADKAYALRKEAEIERDSLRDSSALDMLVLTKERDEARAEIERLKQEVRPEPSRLEIAAMVAAAWESNPEIRKYRVETGDDLWPIADALLEADALIAAAKEGK